MEAATLTADLFVSADGWARGERSPGYFGYFGPDLQRWIDDESARPHVYRPAKEKQVTQRRMLVDLMHKAFDGSAGSLVMQALSSRKASPGELAEIRRLLAQLEGESP